jgi:ABC-type Fe3+-hydroxamate transport system substrate-binding protein
MFIGCRTAQNENERSVIDDLGHRIKIKRDVKKVVSLVPTNSEHVCILDCNRLYGGTRYDRFPAELVKRVKEGKIKIIGGGFDPNLEMIIEIKPDVILANGPSQQRVVLPLKRMGYPILSLYPKNIDRLKRDFLLLGEILGRKAKSIKIVKEVESRLKEIQKKTRPKKRIRVYLQTWPNPMITVGKGSFSHSLITLAGGINVFGDMLFDSGKVGIEWIIKRNPQVLIFTDHQAEFVKKIVKRPEWRQIAGVKNNHICLINETFLRRRIQFIDGLEKIYECLFLRTAEDKTL